MANEETSVKPPVKPTVKPPRPPNSWILFRRWVVQNLVPRGPGEPRYTQAEVSRIARVPWQSLPTDQRAIWDRMADEARADHKLKYPGYKYQPMKKEEKLAKQAEAAEEKRLAKAMRNVPARRNISARSARAGSVHPYLPSLPVNMAHYTYANYTPAARYTFDGPSPPMSAASSPEPESPGETSAPSPFPTTILNTPAEQLPFPLVPIAVPQPLENADFTALVLEAAQVDNQQVDSEEAVPAIQDDATANPWNYFQNDVNWNAHNLSGLPAGEEASTFDASSSLVTFEIPETAVNNVDNWLESNNNGSFEQQIAMMGGNEYQAFDMTGFNFDVDTTDGFDINVGSLPPYEGEPDYFATSFGAAMGQTDYLATFPQYASTVEDFDLNAYLASEDPTVSSPLDTFTQNSILDTTNTMALQPVENSISNSSTQLYVPPTGAANSGNRRVAASYKKEQLYNFDSNAAYEVPA